VPVLDAWERDLQQLLVLTLREALGDWAAHVMVTGIAPPPGTLARSMLDEARAWAHPRGIWIMRVRVYNIWLEPAAGSPWSPTSAPHGAGASAMSGRSAPSVYPDRVSSTRTTLYPANPAAVYGALARSAQPVAPPFPVWQALGSRASSVASWQALGSRASSVASWAAVPARMPNPYHSSQASHASQVRQPGEADEPMAASSPPTPASAEVLAAAYEAVRDGRISDPLTIRGIAHAFAQAAERASAASEFPFDAATAARILWEYADKLDQRLGVSARSAHP
jgi:hypothetical protein